jgi:hypothetical protein
MLARVGTHDFLSGLWRVASILLGKIETVTHQNGFSGDTGKQQVIPEPELPGEIFGKPFHFESWFADDAWITMRRGVAGLPVWRAVH